MTLPPYKLGVLIKLWECEICNNLILPNVHAFINKITVEQLNKKWIDVLYHPNIADDYQIAAAVFKNFALKEPRIFIRISSQITDKFDWAHILLESVSNDNHFYFWSITISTKHRLLIDCLIKIIPTAKFVESFVKEGHILSDLACRLRQLLDIHENNEEYANCVMMRDLPYLSSYENCHWYTIFLKTCAKFPETKMIFQYMDADTTLINLDDDNENQGNCIQSLPNHTVVEPKHCGVFRDQRQYGNKCRKFPFHSSLRPYQAELIDVVREEKTSVIIFPPKNGMKLTMAEFIKFHIFNEHSNSRPARVCYLSVNGASAIYVASAFERYLPPQLKVISATLADTFKLTVKTILSNDVVVATPLFMEYCFKSLLPEQKLFAHDFTLIIIEDCHTQYSKSYVKYLMDHFLSTPKNAPQLVGLYSNITNNSSFHIDDLVDEISSICSTLQTDVVSVLDKNKEDSLNYERKCYDQIYEFNESDSYFRGYVEMKVASLHLKLRFLKDNGFPFPKNSDCLMPSFTSATYMSWLIQLDYQLQITQQDPHIEEMIVVVNCLREYYHAIQINLLLPTIYATEFLKKRYSILKNHIGHLNAFSKHCSDFLEFLTLPKEGDANLKWNDNIEILEMLISIVKDAIANKSASRIVIFVSSNELVERVSIHLTSILSTYNAHVLFLTHKNCHDNAYRRHVFDCFTSSGSNILVTNYAIDWKYGLPDCDIEINYNDLLSDIGMCLDVEVLRKRKSKKFLLYVDTFAGIHDLLFLKKRRLFKIINNKFNSMPKELFSKLVKQKSAESSVEKVYAANLLSKQKLKLGDTLYCIKCRNCRKYISSSKDLRKFLDLNVVADSGIFQRVQMEIHKDLADDNELLNVGKIYCSGCNEDRGNRSNPKALIGYLISYCSVFLCQLKVDKICFEKSNKTSYSRDLWSEIEKKICYIKEMENIEWMKRPKQTKEIPMKKMRMEVEQSSGEESEESSKEDNPVARPSRNVFVDVEVSDDDMEDSGEHYDSEEEEVSEEEAMQVGKEMSQGRASRAFFNKMNEQQMTEYFENRYSRANWNDDEGQYSRKKKGFLNKIAEPRTDDDAGMWIIKTRFGDAKKCATALFKKYCNLRNEGVDPKIKSITIKEGSKDYIYIEAYQKGSVRDFVARVPAILANDKFTKIRDEEILNTIAMKKSVLVAGGFVRFSNTLYRDDLAEIIETNENSGKVLLRLVPRIDYSRQRSGKDIDNGLDSKANSKRKFTRIPKALFNQKRIKNCGGQVFPEGDYTMFENNMYKHGFLYKWFNVMNIYSLGVIPSIDEIKMFKVVPGRAVDDGFERKRMEFEYMKYQVGEKVIIRSGELSGSKGVIFDIRNQHLSIKPINVGQAVTKNLVVKSSNVSKYFDIGDHVKCECGKVLDSGIVVKASDRTDTIIFLSDLTRDHVEVLANECLISGHVSAGVDSCGKFSYLDFVKIDVNTVGVIIKITGPTLLILNQHNETVEKTPTQLMDLYDGKHCKTFDSARNQIQMGSQISVIQGSFVKNKNGEENHSSVEVACVFKNFIFARDKSRLENSGFFVVRQKQIVLYGSKMLTEHSKTPNILNLRTGVLSEYMESKKSILAPLKRKFDTNGKIIQKGGRHRRDAIIGKSVQITQGPYKGHLGFVKDTSETVSRVELHAACKIINVARDRIRVVESDTSLKSYSYHSSNKQRSSAVDNHYGSYDTNGAKTPRYGAKTPGYMGGGTTAYTESEYMDGNISEDDNSGLNTRIGTPAGSTPCRFSNPLRSRSPSVAKDNLEDYLISCRWVAVNMIVEYMYEGVVALGRVTNKGHFNANIEPIRPSIGQNLEISLQSINPHRPTKKNEQCVVFFGPHSNEKGVALDFDKNDEKDTIIIRITSGDIIFVDMVHVCSC
uniref:DRB sensitivity-inducing factor large subunit n=1 Tax=Rhabditophanes sp. KR3021 TaxID=114890 RepID=A0AC35UFR7_9BILA